MSTIGHSYRDIRRGYLRLFERIEEYRREHPTARLEYDELSADDPTIGFVHQEGCLGVHTVFILHVGR